MDNDGDSDAWRSKARRLQGDWRGFSVRTCLGWRRFATANPSRISHIFLNPFQP